MTEHVASPSTLMEQFATRAAEGDLDGLMNLYAEDAIFQPVDGVQCRGRDEIRAALSEMTAIRPTISFDGDTEVVITADIALVKNVWAMKATTPDGSVVQDGGISADVLQRQPDGGWLILIDQPRGTHPT